MREYVLIALLAGAVSSFSQILLKKSSDIVWKSRYREYFNAYVITGYGMTAISMLMMVFAFKGLPYRYGAILESLAYIYIMILSRLFLKETITLRKVIGNCIIVIGVIVFSS